MATIVRSKSCSFIPQDLPISELFLDIKANRERIYLLKEEIFHLRQLVGHELNKIIAVVNKEFREVKARVSVHDREIKALRVSLEGMEHQILQNTKDIKQLNQHLQELSFKVDSLSQTALC